MAVSYDNTTSDIGTASPTRSIVHTCSGSDRVLVAFIRFGNTITINSVTYNGVSLTNAGTQTASGSHHKSSIWYLIGPATGSNNLVITTSSTAEVITGIISFTGANNVQNYAGATNADLVISSATGNMVADGTGNSNNQSATVGADQTQRFNIDTDSWKGSTEAGAASVTMSWSNYGTNASHIAIDIVAGSQVSASTSDFFNFI